MVELKDFIVGSISGSLMLNGLFSGFMVDTGTQLEGVNFEGTVLINMN
jgi:hypothetical protein